MPPVPHRRHVLYLNEWGACGNCWYIDVGGSHRVTSTAAGGVADADDRSLLTTNCLSSSSSSTLHQLQGLSCLDISVLILTYSWSVLWSFSQQVLKVPYIDIRLHHRRARIVKSYSPSGPVCTPIQFMVPWAPTSLHANRNLSRFSHLQGMANGPLTALVTVNTPWRKSSQSSEFKTRLQRELPLFWQVVELPVSVWLLAFCQNPAWSL